MSTSTPIAHASGTFDIGGETTVHRLGYGAMQLTGEGVWGPPKDHDESVAVLRRAAELGVDLFDTADSYGPFVSEELIREALHPYTDVVIATKAGLTRPGPADWRPVGREGYLRQQLEGSLRRLGVETIDLWQLHRIDPKVPADEQFGMLRQLLDAGKVQAVTGVSAVEPNAPFVAFVEQAVAQLFKQDVLKVARVIAPELVGESIQADWRSLSTAQVFWLPLIDREGEVFGGLWLARDVPWNPSEQVLLSQLGDTYSHAWLALTPPMVRRSL